MDLLDAIYFGVNWMEFENLGIYGYFVWFDFKCLNVWIGFYSHFLFLFE